MNPPICPKTLATWAKKLTASERSMNLLWTVRWKLKASLISLGHVCSKLMMLFSRTGGFSQPQKISLRGTTLLFMLTKTLWACSTTPWKRKMCPASLPQGGINSSGGVVGSIVKMLSHFAELRMFNCNCGRTSAGMPSISSTMLKSGIRFVRLTIKLPPGSAFCVILDMSGLTRTNVSRCAAKSRRANFSNHTSAPSVCGEKTRYGMRPNFGKPPSIVPSSTSE
mmetsp:Transcript_98751/g.247490  ORF Transcript_98751/g.247490 Transcript_98751/m.247490 type:complete len:224 (+) Transcript_98751:367-1038(+)